MGYRCVNQRKAFGKPLHSLAVVRGKLALMISRVESQRSWLENITYYVCNMVRLLARSTPQARVSHLLGHTQSYEEQANKFAGQTAFLKSHMTRSAQHTAAAAVQIFGAHGITQSGMGQVHRTCEHALYLRLAALIDG